MPVKVRRFCTSILFSTLGAASAAAQTPQATPATPDASTSQPAIIKAAPTSAEVMRERISKAKAFIAVRNYNAAIYELENIRRETSDSSVNAVANVLLMNSYLEQGDHKRAQDFLAELYTQQKSNKANAGAYYASVAAQVVKSSRNQLERYRSLGLTVSDRNLPLEALNDIERMRETLEIVVTQAKEMSGDKTRSAAAMAMLEEASNSRSALARDEYDARRWRDAVSDSREQLANSRSVITNAVDGTVTTEPSTTTVAARLPVETQTAGTSNASPVFRPISETPAASTQRPVYTEQPKTQPANPVASADQQRISRVVSEQAAKPTVRPETPLNVNTASATPAATQATAKDSSPLDVGSLTAYATERSAPVYPSAARTVRASGVVKVELTIDEKGTVASVDKASGPALLQNSAKDAVRKWKFKPFTRDGQPVRATGFVAFNFNL